MKPAPAWQPIETAPKDGRDLLLWAEGQPVIATWQVPGSRSSVGWNAGWFDAWNFTFEVESPTHWMLLPEPPQ